MRFKKLLNKKNAIAITTLVISIIVAFLIVKDPFHLRYRNSTVSLTAQELKILSQNIAKGCSSAIDRQECYKLELSELTKLYGIANGEAILYAVQDYDETAKGCHIISHYMSNEAYKRAPWEFYKLLDTVNVNACGSGFLHGVLEAYTRDHPEITIDGAFANDLCSRSQDRYRQNMCIHFLGHIFLLNEYGEIEKALPFCEEVRKQWEYDCYDGIFMEDAQKLILAEHGIMPKPVLNDEYVEKLEDRCLTYTGEKGRACWVEMAETYAHTYGYYSDMVYKRCQLAQQENYRKGCYFKGVIAMAVYPTFSSPQALTKLCSYYKNNMQVYGECVYTLISTLMFYSPKFVTRGQSFCSNIISSYRDQCFTHLTRYLKTLVKDKEERLKLCTVLSPERRALCEN